MTETESISKKRNKKGEVRSNEVYMATLMEKDVLLELTTGAMALLSKQNPTKEINIDNKSLYNYYDALISNPPEIFDFTNMAEKIKEIYNKYDQ